MAPAHRPRCRRLRPRSVRVVPAAVAALGCHPAGTADAAGRRRRTSWSSTPGESGTDVVRVSRWARRDRLPGPASAARSSDDVTAGAAGRARDRGPSARARAVREDLSLLPVVRGGEPPADLARRAVRCAAGPAAGGRRRGRPDGAWTAPVRGGRPGAAHRRRRPDPAARRAARRRPGVPDVRVADPVAVTSRQCVGALRLPAQLLGWRARPSRRAAARAVVARASGVRPHRNVSRHARRPTTRSAVPAPRLLAPAPSPPTAGSLPAAVVAGGRRSRGGDRAGRPLRAGTTRAARSGRDSRSPLPGRPRPVRLRGAASGRLGNTRAASRSAAAACSPRRRARRLRPDLGRAARRSGTTPMPNRQRARAELRAQLRQRGGRRFAPLAGFTATPVRGSGRRDLPGDRRAARTRARIVDWYVVSRRRCELSVGCQHTAAGARPVAAACATGRRLAAPHRADGH